MTNNVIVGYFSAAEKIIFALKGMISPIVNAVYPRVNSLKYSSPAKAHELISKIIKIHIIIFGLVSLTLFLYAKPLVLIILGDKYLASIDLIQYMSVVPFFVSISLVYSVLIMLTFEMKVELFRVTLSTGILSLFITSTLCYFYGVIGVAASVSITELIILLNMAYVLKINKFKLI
jgi:PST family polysaccharide transporter